MADAKPDRSRATYLTYGMRRTTHRVLKTNTTFRPLTGGLFHNGSSGTEAGFTFRVDVSRHREPSDEPHCLDGVHAHESEVAEVHPVGVRVLLLVHLADAGEVLVWYLAWVDQKAPNY